MSVGRVAIPFTGRTHPQARSICAQTRVWTEAMRMMSPQVAENFDQLAYPDLATLYSFDATREGAQIMADLCSWYFVWDDQVNKFAVEGREAEWQQQAAQLRACLRDPAGALATADPTPRAFADLLVRTRRHFSDAWWQRYTQHWTDVIDVNDREFTNRRIGHIETIEDFLDMRRRSVGMFVWADLIELASRTELPQHLYCSAPYQACIIAVADYCACCNDLHSLAKERAVNDPHNIITVISRARGCSQEDAVHAALQRMTGAVEDYLQAEQALASRAVDDSGLDEQTRHGLRRCLLSMRDWIANMDGWHRNSARYHVEPA
ncbi:hypothetical protein AQI95_02770 [Streptomyces yokosukanensis]|uniref:Terpene synthase n=1 Tax=Streptomyces yokosukanensis TaxID=67386 RepID=A0A101PED6_9ACTN|nr:hypothetical protein [Streptomyces yokosukanensis]KUN09904.1 hypothetical protein AQI95_02770 [Streptomyces yokosukanensis]